MSIRGKLIFGIAAALLTSILLMIVLNIFQVRKIIESQLTQSDLPANVTAITYSLEKDMLPAITAAQLIVDNVFLHQWLNQGESGDQLPLVEQFLDNAKTRLGADSAFVISNNTNYYYTDQGYSHSITPDTDAWFYSFLNEGTIMRTAHANPPIRKLSSRIKRNNAA